MQDFLINSNFLLSPTCLEPTRFETYKYTRQQTLDINLESCAFRWFVLYIYTTMQGTRHVKWCPFCGVI